MRVQTEEWRRFIPGSQMYKGKKTLFYNGEILWDADEGEYLVYDEEEQHSWEVIIVMPGVEEIPEETFSGCDKIETVIMADTVRRIEWSAFASCNSLVFVRLSRNLEVIGDYAFCGCDSLTSIFIPPSCAVIDKCAFYGSSDLRIFNVPRQTQLGEGVIERTALIEASPFEVDQYGDYDTSINENVNEFFTSSQFTYSQHKLNMSLSVDASNPCVPPTSNLTSQCPPLPRTIERGIPLPLHGNPGRINNSPDSPPLLLYPSKHSVVLLNLATGTSFVYRGHTANVTVARFSPSGAYIASADVKGKLRVWSFDNEEHLCKLDITALSGPIRDLAWDFESKRIAVVGEGSPSDPSSVCTRVIQWDTGVKIGDLGQHSRKKASSVSFKPNRPMRIVTGGSEDFKVIMNKGPPFQRIAPQEEDGEMVPMENAHQKGSVHCVRYNHDGSMLATVGTDKAVVFYDGKTMKMIKKLDNVHTASIYSCAFNHDGTKLLTCAADGTAKLIALNGFEITNTWDVADYLKQGHEIGIKRVPLGCMLMGCAFVLQNGGSEDVPVVVGMNGNICTLSEDTNSVISIITGHQAPISDMTIDHDKNMMYTTDSDGVIVQWDVSDSTLVKAVTNIQRDTNTEEGFDETVMNKVHPGAITGITHTSSSILSIGWDDNVRISTDSSMKLKFKLNAQPNAIAKGTELVAIMTVKGLQIMKDDELVSEISLPYEATSICVAKSDDVMYVGGNDSNTIHIYKINQHDYSIEEIHQISGIHAKPVYSLALSNDGSKLASADDKDICVWDAEGGSYAPIVGKGRWCFHRQRINALAWSKDDSVLASGAMEESIYFWSVNKKTTRVHYPHSHRGGVVAMEFLKNATGHILISVGNDACVNRWDVTDDIAKKFG